MRKKDRILELETELRILSTELALVGNRRSYHARDNRKFVRMNKILDELESISFKYRLKKTIRRMKKKWQRLS